MGPSTRLSSVNFGWVASADVYALDIKEVQQRLAFLSTNKRAIRDEEERTMEIDEESIDSLVDTVASGALAPYCSRSNSRISTPPSMDVEEPMGVSVNQGGQKRPSLNISTIATQVITPPYSMPQTPILGSLMSPSGVRTPLKETSPFAQSPMYDSSPFETVSPSRGKPLSPLTGIVEGNHEEPFVATTRINAFGKRPSEGRQGDPNRIKRGLSNDGQDEAHSFCFRELEEERNRSLFTIDESQEEELYPPGNQWEDPDSMRV